jgi:cytochrome c553
MIRMRLLSLGFALLATTAASAATDVALLERGCLECHNDTRRGALPILEGQHADYLALELRHFREQHRHAWPMSTIANGLNEAESQALARRLAALPWRETAAPRRNELQIAAGAALVARFECASCHGSEFAGAGVVPRTAGQRAVYLERQLRAFAAGTRHHPPTGTGARMHSLDAREAAAVAHFLASLAPGAVTAVEFAWLAGHWCGTADGTESEEYWLASRGGMLLGLHRDLDQGRASGFEFMRIVHDAGSATLYAQVSGRTPATAFTLAEYGPRRAVFANPDHDYPKRVTYERRDPNTLVASIDGGPGTEATRWTWTKACAGAPTPTP